MSGVTRPSESAPVTVTSLNVEPGSYVSVTARLRCSVGRDGRTRCSRRSRAPAPSRAPRRCVGSSTTAVAAFAPQCATVWRSTASAFAWIVWSIVVNRSAPFCSGARLDHVDRAAERRRARSCGCPACPASLLVVLDLEPGRGPCCRCPRSRSPARRPCPAGTSRRSSGRSRGRRMPFCSSLQPPSPDRRTAARRRSCDFLSSSCG